MKIGIVIPSLSGGGAEFVAKEWSKWLSCEGDSVTIILTHPKLTDVVPEGVSVVNLVGPTPVDHVRQMRKLVRASSFDFVIGLLPYFNLLAILGCVGRLGRRPKVLISGRNVEVPFPDVHGKNVRLTRAISRVLYPFADGYIAISHPVAAEAGALYRIRPEKMRVVPNPSTAKVLASAREGNIEGHQQKQGENGAAVVNVIVPARLVEQKRPLIAVEAASLIASDGQKVVLHFFGDGPLKALVQEKAIELGVETKFHGWVENWFSESPKQGVVVLTSLAEGFGNVLVEAAAIGLPSVASSRCLGSADAIVPGITGEFAAGDSAQDYAVAITKALKLKVSVDDIGGWLGRFSPDSSGSSLRSFLQSFKS